MTDNFTKTENEYDSTSKNLNSMVEDEFGSGADIADWNDISKLYKEEGTDFTSEIGIDIGDGAAVLRDGQQFRGDSDRAYFLKLGEVSSSFLSHDQVSHDGTPLHLGSWDGEKPVIAEIDEQKDGDGSGNGPADETTPVSGSDGEQEIATIPEGATDVEVELSGPTTLDLALDAGDTEIVDWQDGEISGGDGGTTTYQGAEISWSGYSSKPESLTIDGPVAEDLSLIFDPLGDGGSGELSYSWDESSGSEPNQAPEGEDDTLTATAGEALTVSAEELLANDSDPDGDELNIVSAGDTENGDLSVEPASGPADSLTFTPEEGVDEASFQYVVSDGDKNDTTDVDVEVEPAEQDDGDDGDGSGGAVDETTPVSGSDGEQEIATIPEGATDVEVELSGPTNLDLALDAGDTEIVDWEDGEISGADGGTTTYQGAEISWSGYSSKPESLTIDDPVPEDLSLILDPYDDGGNGELSYSWDGTDSGDSENPEPSDLFDSLETSNLNSPGYDGYAKSSNKKLSWKEAVDFVKESEEWYDDDLMEKVGLGSFLPNDITAVDLLAELASIKAPGAGLLTKFNDDTTLGGDTDLGVSIVTDSSSAKVDSESGDVSISAGSPFLIGATNLPGLEEDAVDELHISKGDAIENKTNAGVFGQEKTGTIDVKETEKDLQPDTEWVGPFVFETEGVYKITPESLVEGEQEGGLTVNVTTDFGADLMG